MKLATLSKILLVLLSFTGCTHQEELQPTTTNLAGNWSGTNETQQAGSCSWAGPASIPVTASWQVTGTTVTGTINRQVGQTSVPTLFAGSITGSQVKLSETTANNVICNGLGRTYFSRYEGIVTGNTVRLVSLDTICPAQGCVFRRTLTLTRQ